MVKVDFATGKIRWILCTHDHWQEPFRPLLLEPAGKPFEWPWRQHAPAVDYEIDQEAMELILEDTDDQSYQGYRVYRFHRMSLYPPNLQIQ